MVSEEHVPIKSIWFIKKERESLNVNRLSYKVNHFSIESVRRVIPEPGGPHLYSY